MSLCCQCTFAVLLLSYAALVLLLQAYRLEPLILKHYSTVKPLVIHSFESSNKTPYTKMETRAYAAFQGSSELLDSDKMDMSDKESVESGGSSLASKDESASPSQKKKLSFKGMLQWGIELS